MVEGPKYGQIENFAGYDPANPDHIKDPGLATEPGKDADGLEFGELLEE
ncbi:hypothetical protein [Candidatus Nanohalococcus occultus]|uniref:Uncharacterized protein n=1 Tax=Candidatus Nanohalococcus occultus TaxID=2978047 RepID=A0ABY8CD25_9ARCH|nr:hypothetical protein SVXNc_0076 [Candidatus Nanohaloarchaeota archaeon SVXNc]